MKNFIKWFGIIALVVVIGFSMIGCQPLEEDGDGNGDDNNGGGNNGGGVVTYPTITIKNSTGYTLSYSYIKPSTSTDWGSDIGPSWNDGESKTVTLSQPLSAQRVYDIRLSQNSGGSGYNFIKYGITILNGMTITFTNSDYNDGNSLPNGDRLPTITIQNRSGVTFNSVHVKPSSSSDWGTSLGSISNNGDRTVTIPIPPSNYTVFDIQMRSSNPTNTYTRINVTIANGMILIYTSADRDNPTIELPVIVIQNNTGYTLSYSWIKPSTSTNWGSDIGPSWNDGDLKTVTLPQHLSAQNIYDIRLRQSSNSGFMFTKYNVSVSEGVIVKFNTSDLEQ